MLTHRMFSVFLKPWAGVRRCATDAAVRKRQAAREIIHKIDITNGKSDGKILFEDSFGRKHNYLRISLTERCNLRCLYCMPEEGVKLQPNSHLLTSDEIVRLVEIFARNGIDKIRLTGGEPTIRKDLPELIGRINAVPGINSIGITSNGIVLHRYLEKLRNVGLTKVNLSLDTLDQHKFMMMTRRNGFAAVMKTITLAETLFPMVKINNVVMKNINDNEICDFIELTKHRNLDVRFIEYMPFGGNHFTTKKFVDYKTMLADIHKVYDGTVERLHDAPNDTTKGYKVAGYRGQFGFITSMSEHFCDTCNRLRITADGNLKVCLHGNAEVSMRDLLRGGASESEITDVIQKAVGRKKKQHAGFRHGKSATHGKSTNDSYRRLIAGTTHPSKFTHVDKDGNAKQVDVSSKPHTVRVAVAEGSIKLTPEISTQISSNNNKKGDVLTVAKLAAIMAAKQTANLIPLCHNIPISQLDVQLKLIESECRVSIRCTAKTVSNTGIEMEALTACSIAALTIYDMCKAVSSEMVIGDIRLVLKTGGKKDYFAS